MSITPYCEGGNKQQIFEDEDDYIRFLDILRTQTVPEEGRVPVPLTFLPPSR